MHTIQQYEKYKDSGIAWIGEIPEHWEINKIKHCANINPTYQNTLIVEELVSFAPMECLTNCKLEYKEKQLKEVASGYTFFADNDIIMAKVTPCFENGNIAIAKNLINGIGFGSSELYVFRAKTINTVFLLYLLQSHTFRDLAISTMYGTGGLKRVSLPFIKNYKFAFPPLSEQEQIADYLDKKCTLIDESIEKSKTSIEKLKEYKQAIITEAVTKGLNKSTPLKNSNIEWIGQIPEHWEKRKLYSLLSSIGSGTTPKEKSENGDILWLNTGDLNDSYINTTSKTITQEIYNNYSMLKLYKVSSIVIAMYGATIGKLGIINTPMTTNQACCVMQCSNQLYNKFLFYLLFSTRDFLISLSYGAGQPNINQEIIKNFKFFLPPLSEQEEIAAYLDKKCAEIDTAIQGKEKLIEKLTEYKKSLIFECVTGKRKVAVC